MKGKELLKKLPIEEQHKIIATVAMIIEQQDCESLMTLPENCSIYDDTDMHHYMMYKGFDYPDADEIKAYVESIIELSR